jgi:hypothetical protein
MFSQKISSLMCNYMLFTVCNIFIYGIRESKFYVTWSKLGMRMLQHQDGVV